MQYFSDQETLASNIQSFLQLDRVETVSRIYEDSTESEDDESFMIYQMQVEVKYELM